MKKISRRKLLTFSVPAAIGAVSMMTGEAFAGNVSTEEPVKKKKLMVIGAHPDDPETGCGGLMALYSSAGQEVISVYLTRGEAGVSGKSHEEAAGIRTAEALEACKILHARPEFLGQIDGDTEITRGRYKDVYNLLKKELPDIIVTHWPIDSHRDHRICSVLAYDAWLRMGRKSAFYYFEVMSGHQSQNFNPTQYIDITSVIAQKHQACFVHRSQNIEGTYDNDHGKMEIFRGMESGYKFAEAFIRHVQSPEIYL
jgi:LmbE family N-acetylglucosaminyl deacetylase